MEILACMKAIFEKESQAHVGLTLWTWLCVYFYKLHYLFRDTDQKKVADSQKILRYESFVPD